MTTNPKCVAPGEELAPEDQSEHYWLACTKPWFESGLGRTEDQGPCQKTINSGGASGIHLRRCFWDFVENFNKKNTSKKNTQLTISNREANNFDPAIFCFFCKIIVSVVKLASKKLVCLKCCIQISCSVKQHLGNNFFLIQFLWFPIILSSSVEGLKRS